MAKGIEYSREGLMSQGIRVLLLLGVLAAFVGMPAFGADTPVVIKVWNMEIAQKKFYQQIFKDFNKANPDIKVEYTAQGSWEVLTKALDDAFKAGDPPDLFPAGIPFGEAPYPWSLSKDVELGLLIPLDSIAPSKEALSAWMARFPKEKRPFVEGLNVISGKTYSWPVAITWGMPGSLFYNTRLFQEAGLKGSDGKLAAPETWDDLRQFAKKITQAGQGKVYGIVDWKGLEGVILPAVSSGFSDIGFSWWGWGFDHRTGRHDLASPYIKGAIQLWIDMKNDGSVLPGSLISIEGETVLAKFTGGLAGMLLRYFPGAWLTESQDFDVAPTPVMKKGQRVNLHIGPLAIYGGYVLSNKVKSKETAVWKVIEFMTSQTYQESWVKAVSGASLTLSVFPQFNKPELFPVPAYAKIADMTQQMKVGPDLPVGAYKVATIFAPGSPSLEEAIVGIYEGKMDWKVLDEMNVRFDTALDKALVDAKKEGVNLTRADFTFPDYDPTKDYVPKKK